VNTQRLETFADGVFAIAATLLILDVRPEGEGDLGNQLLHAWPQYAAYAISFLTIGIIWSNHHGMFVEITSVNRLFLLLNVMFLMFVAFIPFPTKLIAEHMGDGDARASVIAYGVVLTTTAVLFNAVWRYAASGNRLLRPDADEKRVRGITRSYTPGPFIYAAATLMGSAFPEVGVVMFGAIALFYAAESARFG
jgi:uncharacterized membrane protein